MQNNLPATSGGAMANQTEQNSMLTQQESAGVSEATGREHRFSDLSLAVPDTPVGLIKDFTVNERSFGIRLADTDEGRNSASLLISKMYATRGYPAGQVKSDPNRITLTATDKGAVIGTVTLGIDSPIGLLADEVFKDKLDAFRARGEKVCEITKLAVDSGVQSKAALAALFHTLFIYGRYLHHCTEVFIEVNPRHRRFYESLLGFQRQAEVRQNTRVDAPAWLLSVSLDYVAEQIERFGGNSSNPGNRNVHSSLRRLTKRTAR